MSEKNGHVIDPPGNEGEVTSPSVLSQGAEAVVGIFNELSEGPSQSLVEAFDGIPSHIQNQGSLPQPEESEHDEWYDIDLSVDRDIVNLFEVSQRREALAILRNKIRERIQSELKPKHILLRDKITFTLGSLDLLVSAYWLGASPSTFRVLFSFKAVFLLFTRWIYYRAKRWHYYMFDLCYAVQLLLLFNVWVWPDNAQLTKVTFAFALGPLLWSILAFRNSLVYHSLDKVTSLFLHFFPACVAWAHRFHPPPEVTMSFQLNPEKKTEWETATVWDLCFLPMGPYLVWAILYGLKIFVISSNKIKAKQYETLYGYVTSRRGIFSAVVLRFPKKLQPLAYLGLHMVLTQIVMLANTVWWSSEKAALGCIVVAFMIAAWHGAMYYFDHFSRKYLSGLGLDGPQTGKTKES